MFKQYLLSTTSQLALEAGNPEGFGQIQRVGNWAGAVARSMSVQPNRKVRRAKR